jgi:hypothetical protein
MALLLRKAKPRGNLVEHASQKVGDAKITLITQPIESRDTWTFILTTIRMTMRRTHHKTPQCKSGSIKILNILECTIYRA